MLFRCARCDVEYNPELAIHYCSGVGSVSTGYTATNSTSGYNTDLCVCSSCGLVYATGTGHICSLRCPLHLSTLPCAWCQHALLTDDTIINALYSQQEETLANNIDEQQITLLDNMRSARDAAYRYAQSKHDRATLMRIQADALEAEGNEIVSEINEGVPAPESE